MRTGNRITGSACKLFNNAVGSVGQLQDRSEGKQRIANQTLLPAAETALLVL